MATTSPRDLHVPARTVPAAATEAKFIPIRFWAGIGGLVLAFEIFVMVKWVTGPYFTTVPPGPSEAPDWMMFSLRAMEAGFFALWMWCVWQFFVKPWLRERTFTFDGLLCMALFVFAWFQDPLANYGGAVFTYNANLVNIGSWLNEVPGNSTPGAPGAQLPEPLWTMAIYPGVIFLATILGSWFMRKVKQRLPSLGVLGLIGVVFPMMVVFDIVLEGFILMPLGAYTYAGSPDWSTINDSHYYKYTLIEGLAFGAVWTAWASLRYFRDDKGHSVVERGVEKLNLSQRRAGLIRFLAIGGFVAVTQMVLVNVPSFWTAQHMDTFPTDIQKRSYFLDGMCGEGTGLACTGKGPVAADGSAVAPKPVIVPLGR